MRKRFVKVSSAVSRLFTARFFVTALLASVLVFFHQPILRFVWYHCGNAISAAIRYVLSAIYGDTLVFRTTPQEALQIVDGDILLRITRACSGLDGWFIFTLAALLIWGFGLRRRSRGGWAAFYVGGLCVVHLLNCARLALMVELGARWLPALGVDDPMDWVLNFAHPYLGTLAYALGLSVYCALAGGGTAPEALEEPATDFPASTPVQAGVL